MSYFGRSHRADRATALIAAAALAVLAGCSYVGSATKQLGYSARQRGSPTQRVYKHMLTRETYFVFGRITHGEEHALAGAAIGLVALSDRFQKDEVVDVNHGSRLDSYYGLNLPAGRYRLLVVCDRNRDGFFDETECIGGRTIVLGDAGAATAGDELEPEDRADNVVGAFDIDLRIREACEIGTFRAPARPAAALPESLFYPKGTIRSLDDPIFAPEMAMLGMYEPAAFLEQAPMMFYALEEDLGYKVPVVFVHGIGGSARDFAEIVARLDRTRYRAWFFHYPSGADLDQLSGFFHRIFLSGKVIPLDEMPMVIVAHSMGGLIVREALNRCTGRAGETRVAQLITIASPLGGHPMARNATRAPMVIPSWRDLSPESEFVQRLHRRPLPTGARYALLYAFGNAGGVRVGENSDGVVPLSSQLDPAAQREATGQFGCNDTHMGVLRNIEAISRVIEIIGGVRSIFPEEHLRELDRGGYGVEPDPRYTPVELYLIRSIGCYMDALVAGSLQPIHPTQTQFIVACRNGKRAANPAESAWQKLNQQHPDRSSLAIVPPLIAPARRERE